MNTVELFGLHWKTAMEGERIIHKGQPWQWYDENMVGVFEKDNRVCMIADRKPKHVTYWDGEQFDPVVGTGLLRSEESFGYGRFGADIRLPRGRNLWPSFWLVGADEPWPEGGEIDIMEAWSNCLGYYRFGIPQPPYLIPSWKTTNNVHYDEYGKHCSTGSRSLPLLFSLRRPAHNFVRYEVEWRSSTINFYVNGRHVRCYGYDVARHLIDKRMRVIFNVWTTGADFSCKTPMEIRNFEYKPLEIL